MNCEVCKKSFNSLMNFKQHELSKKHINKMNIIKMVPPASASKSGLIDEVIHCVVCSVHFNNMIDYQKHSASLEHANMVIQCHNKDAEENNLVTKDAEENKLVTTNGNQFPEGAVVKHVDVSSIKFPGIKCEVCKMNFSGFKPHEQHLQSANHKRKVANMQKFEDPNASFESAFYCKICDKHCSGQAPFIQHCESSGHKKNEAKLHLAKKHNESSPNVRLWYCDICQKQCTGANPFEQHKSSKGHTKNIERFKIESDSLITAESYVMSQQTVIPVSETTNDNIEASEKNDSPKTPDICVPKAIISDETYIRQDDDRDFETPAKKKIKIIDSESANVSLFTADLNIPRETCLKTKSEQETSEEKECAETL